MSNKYISKDFDFVPISSNVEITYLNKFLDDNDKIMIGRVNNIPENFKNSYINIGDLVIYNINDVSCIIDNRHYILYYKIIAKQKIYKKETPTSKFEGVIKI